LRAGEVCALELRAFERCRPQVRTSQLRILEASRREVHLPQHGADQHCAFQMSRAERSGLRKSRNPRLIKLGVIDHVEARQDQPIRPQALGLLGAKVDRPRNKCLAQQPDRAEILKSFFQPLARKGCDREH